MAFTLVFFLIEKKKIRWAAFIVLAVSVVFGKELNELFSINLILFNCLIHLVYCGFRHYIRGCKKNRGYY